MIDNNSQIVTRAPVFSILLSSYGISEEHSMQIVNVPLYATGVKRTIL